MSEKFETAHIFVPHTSTQYRLLHINQTVSAMLTYEHIVTQNKNNTDIIHLNVLIKNIVEITGNNTYNFAELIACLYILHHE